MECVLTAGVMVAASPRAEPVADPGRFDVMVTAAPGAPRPWVTVADIDTAVAQLDSAIGEAPRAAAVLTQVLRVTESLPVNDALVVESLAYATLQGSSEFRRWLGGRPAARARAAEVEPVIVERTGDTVVITLRRDDVRNAYSAAMRDALFDALLVPQMDPTVAQVELRGAGRDFCSGGDLAEFGTTTDPADAHAIRMARNVASRLASCADRVTAHLHGHCIGAGIELAAFADRVHAEPGTVIRLPEVGMGLIPGAGGTVSLPRRIGRHRTAYLALTGQPIDAATALAWNLVDTLAPPDPRS